MEINIKDYLTPPVLLVLFLLAVSLIFVFPVLDMIILGVILAYGIRPIANKIQSKLKYSSISILLAVIIVVIPLILLIAYIVLVIIGVLSDFVLNQNLDFNLILAQLNSYIPQNSFIDSSTIDGTIKNAGSHVLNYLVGVIKDLPDIFLKLFILVASIFYFVRDGDKCYNYVKSFVPSDSMDFFEDTVESVKNVLKSIFFGHFLTSLIIGIFGAIGYSLLGYPYGIFLGVITGILQLIPIFGPWPVYWTLVIVDAINGNYPRVVVVLLFGFFLSLIDMYIRPAISSHHADIHPLILLVGFLAGPLVYGIVGFILGPLILGITYAVLDSYKKNYKEAE